MNVMEFGFNLIAGLSERRSRAVETGRIAEKLYAVKDRDVNLFVYLGEEGALCIDSGYKNSRQLHREFDRIGVDPRTVTQLFLTHADVDHAGGASLHSREGLFNQATVYMSRDEEQMIDGRTRRQFLLRVPALHRDCKLLDDGDVVGIGKTTVRAIATPGHTPGSMSFLVDGTVLFTGDALILRRGRVDGSPRVWNMDAVAQRQSIRKLAALDNVSLLCTAHTRCTHDFGYAMAQWRD